MCSLELCFLISFCGIFVVAIVGAALVAVQFAVPVFLLAALWWVCTLMHQWFFRREPAFQVLQPTAPAFHLLQQPDAATQVINFKILILFCIRYGPPPQGPNTQILQLITLPIDSSILP